MDHLAATEAERLTSLGSAGADGPGFSALAEAERRAGRPEEALRIAEEGLRAQPDQLAGRVALGLALLDLERVDEARKELTRVLEVAPAHPLAEEALASPSLTGSSSEPFDALAEAELESAFEQAESRPDEMVDANDLAEAALRSVEAAPLDDVLAPRAESPFATETVAGLLEGQGFSGQAQAVREVIAEREVVCAAASPAGSAAVIATLERWLVNLRRGSE